MEKLTRKGISTEAQTLIYASLVLIVFLSEVIVSRLEAKEAQFTAYSKASILDDKDKSQFSSMMADHVINTVAFKSALAAAAVMANYLGTAN